MISKLSFLSTHYLRRDPDSYIWYSIVQYLANFTVLREHDLQSKCELIWSARTHIDAKNWFVNIWEKIHWNTKPSTDHTSRISIEAPRIKKYKTPLVSTQNITMSDSRYTVVRSERVEGMSGLILGLRSANKKRRYFATTSLFCWVQT